MEEATTVVQIALTDEVMQLISHIDEGVTFGVHLFYLLAVIALAYGLYRIYTYVFRRFF